jgi:hypothetical protein
MSVHGCVPAGTYPPIPPTFSPYLRALVASMLQQDPKKRPTTHVILSQPDIQRFIQQFESSADDDGDAADEDESDESADDGAPSTDVTEWSQRYRSDDEQDVDEQDEDAEEPEAPPRRAGRTPSRPQDWSQDIAAQIGAIEAEIADERDVRPPRSRSAKGWRVRSNDTPAKPEPAVAPASAARGGPSAHAAPQQPPAPPARQAARLTKTPAAPRTKSQSREKAAKTPARPHATPAPARPKARAPPRTEPRQGGLVESRSRSSSSVSIKEK